MVISNCLNANDMNFKDNKLPDFTHISLINKDITLEMFKNAPPVPDNVLKSIKAIRDAMNGFVLKPKNSRFPTSQTDKETKAGERL